MFYTYHIFFLCWTVLLNVNQFWHLIFVHLTSFAGDWNVFYLKDHLQVTIQPSEKGYNAQHSSNIDFLTSLAAFDFLWPRGKPKCISYLQITTPLWRSTSKDFTIAWKECCQLGQYNSSLVSWFWQVHCYSHYIQHPVYDFFL